jgi:hypothetical protein
MNHSDPTEKLERIFSTRDQDADYYRLYYEANAELDLVHRTVMDTAKRLAKDGIPKLLNTIHCLNRNDATSVVKTVTDDHADTMRALRDLHAHHQNLATDLTNANSSIEKVRVAFESMIKAMKKGHNKQFVEVHWELERTKKAFSQTAQKTTRSHEAELARSATRNLNDEECHQVELSNLREELRKERTSYQLKIREDKNVMHSGIAAVTATVLEQNKVTGIPVSKLAKDFSALFDSVDLLTRLDWKLLQAE